MAYPTSAITFTTKNSGDAIQGEHVNTLQTEVAALEAAMLTGGLAHNLLPATNSTYALGSTSAKWIIDGSQITAGTIPAATLGPLSQTFRGLHLRTGEAGNAATTVTLLHADEIVCNNGARRTPADNLSAVITTAGIGGLRASQAEAASTWYKVMYAYGGSGEGLYLEQAKDYLLDLTQASIAVGEALGVAVNDRVRLAQGIQLVTAGKVEFVDLPLSKEAAFDLAGSVWVTLEGDNAGSPDGTPLATSTYGTAVNVASSTPVGQWIRFVFRAPATLTASTQYHIVLRHNFTPDGAKFLYWYGSAASTYAAGVAKKWNASAWATSANCADYGFKVYVTSNDNAVAPPAGYDTGYAQIGWVYNDSGSDFDPFKAHDRRVQPLSELYILNTGSAAIPTLLDASAFWPSVPVTGLRFGVRNTTDAAVAYILSTYSSDVLDGLAYTAAMTNDLREIGPLLIEYQHLYYSVSTGTFRIRMANWEW